MNKSKKNIYSICFCSLDGIRIFRSSNAWCVHGIRSFDGCHTSQTLFSGRSVGAWPMHDSSTWIVNTCAIGYDWIYRYISVDSHLLWRLGSTKCPIWRLNSTQIRFRHHSYWLRCGEWKAKCAIRLEFIFILFIYLRVHLPAQVWIQQEHSLQLCGTGTLDING